jgi:hypothetical protein
MLLGFFLERANLNYCNSETLVDFRWITRIIEERTLCTVSKISNFQHKCNSTACHFVT